MRPSIRMHLDLFIYKQHNSATNYLMIQEWINGNSPRYKNPHNLSSCYHFSCFFPRLPTLLKNLYVIILPSQMFVSMPQSIFVMMRPMSHWTVLTISFQASATSPWPTLYPLSTWFHNKSMRLWCIVDDYLMLSPFSDVHCRLLGPNKIFMEISIHSSKHFIVLFTWIHLRGQGYSS